MSLSSDIKLNQELIENEYCTITYSGALFKNNSDLVSIVYGFDENWIHTTEQKMVKTENGFVVDVKIQNFSTFNFCFKNSNNEWDNNNYQNYSSPISKQKFEEAFILNENIIGEILDNLSETDLSTIEDEHNNTVETFSENSQQISEVQNIDEKFSSNADEIPSFDIVIEKNEPINIEDSLVNSVEEASLDNDLENLFNDIYQQNSNKETNSDNKQDLLTDILSEPKEQNFSNDDTFNYIEQSNDESSETSEDFNMNSLINDILSPIVKSSIFEEENIESLENLKFEEDVKDIELDESQDNLIDNSNENEKIDTLITNLYKNTIEFSQNYNSKSNEENIIKEETNNLNIEETQKNVEFSSDNQESETNKITVNNPISTNIEDSVQDSQNANLEAEEINEQNINLEDNEDSLIDVLNSENMSESDNTNTSLIEIDSDNKFVVSPRSLNKFYMFKKKIKLTFYKLFVAIPKLLSGNFSKNEDK